MRKRWEVRAFFRSEPFIENRRFWTRRGAMSYIDFMQMISGAYFKYRLIDLRAARGGNRGD